jgi:hypothetical protein
MNSDNYFIRIIRKSLLVAIISTMCFNLQSCFYLTLNTYRIGLRHELYQNPIKSYVSGPDEIVECDRIIYKEPFGAHHYYLRPPIYWKVLTDGRGFLFRNDNNSTPWIPMTTRIPDQYVKSNRMMKGILFEQSYHTAKGKFGQVLLIPAFIIDLATLPIQFFVTLAVDPPPL